jgi:hypothetical protein
MTSERDIERILDRWFVDRPTEVSERVLDDVAGRISRQRQRPGWRLHDWRSTTMFTPFRLAAAAGALLAVLIGGSIFLASGGSPAPPATAPPPSSLAPPRPAAIPLPDGLLENRDYVARAVPGDPMAFTITAPEGWTGFGGFFMYGPDGSEAPGGIAISFNHDPEVVTDPCDSSIHSPAPGSGSPSVDDLGAALSRRDDLHVSGVTDTELGGFSGTRLDIQLPAAGTCRYVFAEPKGLFSNGPSNRWRVWLLDVDGSTAVVVLLDYAGTPAEDRAAAEAAIESIRIMP